MTPTIQPPSTSGSSIFNGFPIPYSGFPKNYNHDNDGHNNDGHNNDGHNNNGNNNDGHNNDGHNNSGNNDNDSRKSGSGSSTGHNGGHVEGYRSYSQSGTY